MKILKRILKIIFKAATFAVVIGAVAACDSDYSFMTKREGFLLPAIVSDCVGVADKSDCWTVTVTSDGSVRQAKLPLDDDKFFIKVNSERLYSISAHCSTCKFCDKTDTGCSNCEEGCVCGGLLFPYQKDFSRVHNFSAQVLSRYYSELKKTHSQSEVLKIAKKFNWSKFIDALDKEYLAQGGDYPFYTLDEDEVAQAILDGSFSATVLRGGS